MNTPKNKQANAIIHIGASIEMGAPISMLAPMWIIAFACLFFGVFTDFILDPAQTAAQNLLSLPGGGIENTLGDGS